MAVPMVTKKNRGSKNRRNPIFRSRRKTATSCALAWPIDVLHTPARILSLRTCNAWQGLRRVSENDGAGVNEKQAHMTHEEISISITIFKEGDRSVQVHAPRQALPTRTAIALLLPSNVSCNMNQQWIGFGFTPVLPCTHRRTTSRCIMCACPVIPVHTQCDAYR